MINISLDYTFIKDGETFTGTQTIHKDQVPKVGNIISIEHKNVRAFLCVTSVWQAALVNGRMRVPVDGDLVDTVI